MNLPNILTVLRIVLTFVFIYFVLSPGLNAKILAAFSFILAALTDFYDGYLARKKNIITDFGKLMDPIADKFLILAAFFVFAQMHLIAVWMVVVVAAREILITGHRIIVKRKGSVIPAEKAGKIKTTAQIAVICVVLLYLILDEALNIPEAYFIILIINALMVGVVLITTSSGISYINHYKFASNARVIS